jgi:pimeloyl-ACP methyl ester carboxylesterase
VGRLQAAGGPRLRAARPVPRRCAWEELFHALVVPTLLLVPTDSPMAPRPEAAHNDLVRTVVVPGAGHCVRRDQPARYLRAVDAFLAEVARA